MKRLLLAACLALTLAAAPVPRRPKLLLTIVIDQFRYDYLTRFESEYTGGFAEMLTRGAVFTNAYYEHFPTVTAIGHSTVLSGATPSISGIVGNEWYDREAKKNVQSITDDSVQMVGAGDTGRPGASPVRLMVSTVPDEIKMANGGRTKAIGISIKDRAAILPAGRMADGAYWFDAKTGNFVTSTFYVSTMPEWAAAFNKTRAVDKYLGTKWTYENKVIRSLAEKPGPPYYGELERTPWSNELVAQFAEAAIEGEKLGQHDGTDVLTISFSAHDLVGHGVGPHNPAMHDLSVQADRTIGGLLKYVYDRIGVENVLVVLTADHGVAPLAEFLHEHKMPGGRMPASTVRQAVQAALAQKYGDAQWVVGYSGPAPYLNLDLIRQKGLNYEEVQNVAAEAARTVPHIYRVYTRAQLMRGQILDDIIDRRVEAGFNAERSSDLFIVIQPYWVFEAAGASHGTPYNYDAHVPVILMGPGIKSGMYDNRIAVNDIAPTLATMLGVEPPSGSSGRVLTEALKH